MQKDEYFRERTKSRLKKLADDTTWLVNSLENETMQAYFQIMHKLLIEHIETHKFSRKTPYWFVNYFYAFNKFCKLCEMENFIKNQEDYYFYKNSINHSLSDFRDFAEIILESNPYAKFMKSFVKKLKESILKAPFS